MQRFPPAQALQCFIDGAIAQVCLDPYAVQLHFESDRRLVAEYRIEHAEPGGKAWRYDCVAAEGSSLVLQRLLCRPIIAVERDDLRLTFRIEDGSALMIYSDIGRYESGHIDAPETGFAVF